MPKIRPISDLRNYTQVLAEVEKGAPVYLTRNGTGTYTISSIDDQEIQEAQIQLLNDIVEGELSATENGWKSLESIKEKFGL